MRPSDKHIDSEELDALLRWSSENGSLPKAHADIADHLESCAQCSRKVAEYSWLLENLSNKASADLRNSNLCVVGENVDWREVASGRWPELRAKQLISHASLCDQCGPLLRAATSLNREQARDEKVETAPSARDARLTSSSAWHWRHWALSAALLLVVIAALSLFRSLPRPRLSGQELAEVAVSTQQQFSEEHSPFDFTSESQQTLNEWLKRSLDYSVVLPESPLLPGESRPYRLEGARLAEIRGRKVAFLTYNIQPGVTSLMVAPASLAIASGGTEAHFKKVTFHYAMVRGYKVVTWSQHGLTYALVSSEGNNTQKSCMVCHSSMRDRDLSETPTPLQN